MQSRDKKALNVRRLALLSVFLGFALIMGFVERLIPFDAAIPGVKLGLTNVVILSAIYIFSAPEAFILMAMKCIVTATLFGSAVSLIYSLSGGVLSFFVMLLLVRLLDGKIGAVGVSVAGAVFHNLGQVAAACAVMQTVFVFYYLPWLLISGVITGILIGFTVHFVLSRTERVWKPFRR